MQQVPPDREKDVLYLDASDLRHPFPFNVLQARDDVERSMLTDELLRIFHRFHGASWGPVLAHQLRMAIAAVTQTGGSLRDVYELFTDTEARARIIGSIRDPHLRTFWAEEFPRITASRRAAVTTKFAPIVFHPVLGPILSAKENVFDADRAIAERQIVLVNLATGTPADDVTTFLGTFLVQKIVAAAYRQGKLPSEKRRRHVLMVDEFQRFMHKAAGFDQILSEARKFKLVLIVANQFVEQLSPEVRAALFGNVGCLAAFRVGHRDARILVPEFSGAVTEDLLELQRGECLVRTGNDWSHTRTLPPPPKPTDDPNERILGAMRERFAAVPRRLEKAVPPPAPPEQAQSPSFNETFELVA